jgi:hypothetical protein
MIETNNTQESSEVEPKRRALLKKIGRFAAVTAPTVTLLLTATAKPKKAVAVSTRSSRQFKNPEGAVDNDALLSAVLVGNAAAFDVIDGIGTCFGAIKALHARIDRLEAAL